MEPFRVLIVDDEEELVLTLAERLTIRGFQVETATTGEDALRRVADNGFNVAVLDVKMPGIDGLELTTEMKQRYPDLPIILFTGHGSDADAKRGMEEGAFDYIIKPVDIEELIQKIEHAADRKRGRDS